MQILLFDWKWIIGAVLIGATSAYGDVSSNEVLAAKQSLEKTRQELKQQGFKTELADFDFSIFPDARAREAVVKEGVPGRVADFSLMETVGSNRAIVVWRQGVLKEQTVQWPDDGEELAWKDFSDSLKESEADLAAARVAILSAPIRFDLDASAGSTMLLRHLADLRRLTQRLNHGVLVELHEGNLKGAWTNLMAATRLVTAWDPEPAEVSHRVRFNNAKLLFEVTWQALQTNGWTDDQLARLQREWEPADFLSRLPEVQAFARAGDVKELEADSSNEKVEPVRLEDAKNLLLFYRDREIEFRNAVQARTWLQMQALPGVTNKIIFEPKDRNSGFAFRLQTRRMTMGMVALGISLLGQAAETETQRRVILTALALERYRGKNQRYPDALSALAPEFIKSVPVDFMTGQALNYRVNDDGQFLLYSVGFDGVDNGGKIQPTLTGEARFSRLKNPDRALPESDIVWPLPASSAEEIALRKQQAEAAAEREVRRKAEWEADQKAEEQEAENSRKAAMEKLLAEKPALGEEPVYGGKPLSIWVIQVGKIEEYNGAPKDAVAAIRAIGSKAVPFLLEWMPRLGDENPVEGFPDWTSVQSAWWALGDAGKAAIPTLARIIAEPEHSQENYSAWTESATAISHMGTDAILPMLTAATNMQGKHELWELLHNFGNLGTNGAPAVSALIHWANDPDYWVRNGVADALGGIAQRSDLAVPVLIQMLKHDTNSMVRRDAAAALGSFANDSEAVLAELTKALKDPDWDVRGGALSGLGKTQSKPEVVVPLITPFLYDKNNVLQRSAAYALRDLESEAGYRALLQASNAPSSWPGIGDIIYEVQEKLSREPSK